MTGGDVALWFSRAMVLGALIGAYGLYGWLATAVVVIGMAGMAGAIVLTTSDEREPE